MSDKIIVDVSKTVNRIENNRKKMYKFQDDYETNITVVKDVKCALEEIRTMTFQRIRHYKKCTSLDRPNEMRIR